MRWRINLWWLKGHKLHSKFPKTYCDLQFMVAWFKACFMSLCLSVCLPVCLSVCLSVPPSIAHYISATIHHRVSLLGDWTRWKFARSSLDPEKSSHQIFIPPLTKSQFTPHPPPPTKQQFSSYNPIKTAFLAVVIAPSNLAPFLF